MTEVAPAPVVNEGTAVAAGIGAGKPRWWRRRWFQRALRVGFLLAILAFAAVAVSDRYDAVRDGVARLSVASMLGCIAAVLASLVLSMLSWRRVLTDFGSPLPILASARIFFVGQLGKYLPGSVWPVVAQMELARDHDVPRTRTAMAGIVAIGIGLVGALLIAGVLLPFAVSSTGWRIVVLISLVVCVAVASPPVLNRLLGLAPRLLRRPPLERLPSTRGLVVATLYAASGWLLQGVAVYALALSLGGGIRLLPLSIGGYAAASALGIVVIIAPAGIGVREPVLVAALSGVLGSGSALVVALAIRLAVSIGDLGVGAIFAALPSERAARRATRKGVTATKQ